MPWGWWRKLLSIFTPPRTFSSHVDIRKCHRPVGFEEEAVAGGQDRIIGHIDTKFMLTLPTRFPGAGNWIPTGTLFTSIDIVQRHGSQR